MSDFVTEFNKIAEKIHNTAKEKGWYDEKGERNLGEAIALMHSELSEALEFLRKGNGPSDKIPEFVGVEEELGDTIIRILDLAQAQGYRIAEAIEAKMEFNKGRPVKHGKKF